jgi:hypothetical protein
VFLGAHRTSLPTATGPAAGRDRLLSSVVTILAALDTTPLAILAVASLVIGYGGIWALWHFVFSSRNEHDDDLDRARRRAAADPGDE